MRNSVLLFIVAASIICGIVESQPLSPDTPYSDFQTHFKKKYSESEKVKRQAIFKKNTDKVKQINNDPKSTYKAALNEYSDWTEEELKVLANAKLQKNDSVTTDAPNNPTRRTLQTAATAYPAIDYRALGKVTPVKNQGQCGCLV